MSVQPETLLQQRIQVLIEKRGGYVNKNHGSMISKTGIADLTICYRGLYVTIEAKVDGNKPSAAQGIHCRLVQKAGGLSCVVWSTKEVEYVLDQIDKSEYIKYVSKISQEVMALEEVDDGRKY